MTSEAAFVAAIAANPEDDLSRLVFSDWLEENGQPERAEFIRLSCQFDPHRDRFDDDHINTLRRRVEVLEDPGARADWEWLEALPKVVGWGALAVWLFLAGNSAGWQETGAGYDVIPNRIDSFPSDRKNRCKTRPFCFLMVTNQHHSV